MATEKITNTDIYANPQILKNWGTGYKLQVDLTSELVAENWMLNLNLPYSIRAAYGIELIDNGNGNYSISGKGNGENLEPGETVKATFIIDSDGQDAILPQFNSLNSQTATPEPELTPDSQTATPEPELTPDSQTATPEPQLMTSSKIVEDWQGGFKVEVDITSEFNAEDWKLDFQMSDSIRNAYGVDLTDNGNGNYSISGQGDWQDLEPGETAKAIFVVDDNGNEATVPQFNNSDAFGSEDNNLMGSVISDPQPAPQDSSDTITPEPEEPVVETAPTDNAVMGSVISDPIPASQPSQLSSNAISVGFENHANGTTYGTVTQRQDWDAAWSVQMNEGELAKISNQEAHSGNNSLEMTYPANAQSNAGAKWQVPSQQEYYLSYWVKFDGNFDFDGSRYSGGKLPGLGSGDLASGGNKPNGNNGFTSRYMWRENGKAVLYLYHMDQPATYGEDIALTGADGSEKYFERGKWHNMIQRVKVNDGSQANGEIDVWMDNEQVLDMDNLRFMTNNQGIDTTYFSTFHGGSGSEWWPDQDVNAYFDDFVVSTNAADVGL